MREREPLLVGGLVTLLLVLWLGFLVHASPRFAGSPFGGVLGVSGGVLMVAALAYSVVKRVRIVKGWTTRRVSVRTALAWHMYVGVLGALLGLLHTGHKFNSPLGISLTVTSLVVVLSGFVGHQLMKRVSLEIREKKELLTGLELAYQQTARELAAHPEQTAVLRPFAGFAPRLAAGFFRIPPTAVSGWAQPAPIRALELADAIADLEYSVRAHEAFKRRFAAWLSLHVVAGVALYGLLGLHVWAGIYFGLRWWP